MYIDYDWVKDYLCNAPSLEEAARVLSHTGLETEVEGKGLRIEHTVNRPDAMCHFGVARELSVRLGLELVEPPIDEAPLADLPGWTIRSLEPEHCSRYMGLEIQGVHASPSPPWLVEKLTAIDQTCHNLLVDLTNFLLWEMGHPSHAFDGDKIDGQTILIRFAEKGERLTTLDGREHDAHGLLVIADAEKPIAFGGVMGGENSEVGGQTRRLLLELACFRPATVRTTGRRCQIESDARHRFERGVDRERMERVIRRFIYLLRREQPQVDVVGLLDADLEPFQRLRINLRRERLHRLLGVPLADDLVLRLLAAMDCRPETNPEGWSVSVPGYKVDVTREVDVIEEVIRFAGFDQLPTTLPALGGTDLGFRPRQSGEEIIRRSLRGAGFQETCTYGFMPEAWVQSFQPKGQVLGLRNPMTANQAVLRRNLLPGMLDCVRRNLNRGIGELAFFEIGHVYEADGEPHHLAVVLVQGKESDQWWRTPDAHPFYRIKGVYQLLADHLGLSLETGPEVPSWLAQEEGLGILEGGNTIGGFGILEKGLAKQWDFEQAPAVLELDLSFLASRKPLRPVVEVLSPFPGMRMDMAFVLDRGHSYDDVRKTLLNLDLPHLSRLDLFDVYEGKAIESGKRSLGFRFRFQAEARTLTSEEVAHSMARVKTVMEQRFHAVIGM